VNQIDSVEAGAILRISTFRSGEKSVQSVNYCR